MNLKHWIFFLFSVVSIGLFSCQKDLTYSGNTPSISTSTDTLTFDTVFTTVGSATRSFKIFNNESEDILIDLSLDNGASSKFRLNVDGIPGDDVEQVVVNAKDSIYVFADVTVDPDQPLSISPFVIEEFITINSGGTQEKVLLTAWGQNANYVPSSKRPGSLSLLSCNLQTEVWDDPKPYVIYGVLFIDSCELNIKEGTSVYIHGGLAIEDSTIYNDGFLIVLENGNLNIEGSVENPVTFQGDRLESSFDDTPGQWVGIRITSGSTNNQVSHTQIKNSIVGIRVDSAAQLIINNSEIFNTSSAGLIGVHANIDATNNLIHSNGQNCAILSYGGNYNFNHCTFASYGNQSSAIRFDNFRCTDPPLCQEVVYVNALNANFTNCLFAGNEKDEILPIDYTGGEDPELFNYYFDHCGVIVEDILDPDLYPDFFDFCNECFEISFQDTLFLDIANNDYRLDTMSLAIDKGFQTEIFSDILNNPRDNAPDPGCYEFVK